MKTIKIIFCVLTCIVFIGACKKQCSDGNLSPVFIGFAQSDLDTIYVREFDKGTNFQHLRDSVMLRLGDVVHWNTGDSTFATLTNYTTYITYMSPAYDYQIYLPAKKRTISIYDIISEQTSMGEGSGGCMNPISSFMQDGQQIKNPDPYYVYIHN